MDKQDRNKAAATKDVVANVQELLNALSLQHSIEPLKKLFWSELNYDRANEPLSRSNWPEATTQLLAEDPLLLATGSDGFPIIYTRLAANRLRTGDERLVVTQLINKYLDGLYIFSDQSQGIWHFVNVKADDLNAKRRLFRRITVGPEERLRTASERLAMLDLASMPSSRHDVIQQHQKAFDVEAVTKKFFDDYKILFDILQKDLQQQTNDNHWSHDYALQFLNRCMFLYFIQRKGWLGNDKDFLHTFWESYQGSSHEKDTFFEQWLQILFFEAFNNKFHGGHTQFPQDIVNILAMAPYLNGGLFSRNNIDRADHTFKITDSRFEQVFRFLEGYNFTIAEDSPLDQEVAVDPEMIGRVYESLVNVSELDERGDAGIFYTPRTELDLMCRLALVDYLTNYIEERQKYALYDAVFALEPEEKSAADDALQALGLWDSLYDPLRLVTIVDPACGSGAFLVGMLQVLDDLQERADRYHGNHSQERENAYERKKRIIGQSLYGVDVMEWAAHIAELRLWLALVVDVDIPLEELHARPDPLLPHLTFKIRYGDSLVQEIGNVNFGYKQTIQGISPILKRRLEKLKAEKIKFFHHDPSCEYKTRDAAMQEEVRLFHDIIMERKLDIDNKLRSLRNRATQSGLLEDVAAPKIATEFTDRQKQIEEKEREKQLLDRALNALTSPKQVPFVWDISFVEIFSGANEGFDIVIGNPPYVRQEQISRPALARNEITRENKQEYKKLLAETIYNDFQEFFQFNQGTGKIGHPINGKSDLYIYFYLHGLRLLNPKGSFCFITSNSWLDVGYGADLQEFLLKHCHVKMILDNQVKRSFASADVNTIITLFSAPTEKPSEEAMNNIARFVMFKVGFEQVLTADTFKSIEQARERTTTPEYRVYPIQQKVLLEDGYAQLAIEDSEEVPQKGTKKHLIKEAQASYSSNKWGGKYLRAPDIYWTILEKGRGKLVRLGDIADVRFGIKTGANEFFYLDAAKIRQWGIEEEFLRPAIKSPRECKSILIDPAALKTSVLLCHKSKEELKGTAALKYIQWGESQGYQKRPSCMGRARWWDLGERRSPNLGFNYLIDSTAKTLYAPNGCYFSDNFQEVHITHQSVLPLCASLNSTIFQLMVNVAGRANFGEGLLKIQTYEVCDLLCLDPALITFTSSRILASVSWDVLSPSRERRTLDHLIFDVLNLTQGEQDAIYEAVINMVEMRLKKAGSLAGQKSLEAKERQKRLEAVEKTLGIWMGLPEEIIEEVERYHA